MCIAHIQMCHVVFHLSIQTQCANDTKLTLCQPCECVTFVGPNGIDVRVPRAAVQVLLCLRPQHVPCCIAEHRSVHGSVLQFTVQA